MGYLLLTGATGLLGRFLMRDLLSQDVPLAVLVRPSRRKPPEQRVEAAMRVWDERLGRKLPRPVVLAGDISQGDLGLSADQIKWAAENCTSMMHNAASLSFVSTGREAEPWKSNVDGTSHVLEFCRQADIRNFHHVSTAYVAGCRQGRCYEHELNVGQQFANCYEESKVEAEEMVRSAKFLDTVTVHRPAIIIGDSQSGMTTTFHNFYAMLEMAYKLSAVMDRFDYTGKSNSTIIGFNLDGHERKHLVPVDWVSAVMSWIVTHPEHHGKTYHLTPRVPITTRLMRDVMEQVIGVYGVKFYGAGARRPAMSETEAIFYEAMAVYESYWKDDPEYDCTNTLMAAPHLPCPHVDREMLLRLAHAAIASNFSWKDPAVERAVPIPA